MLRAAVGGDCRLVRLGSARKREMLFAATRFLAGQTPAAAADRRSLSVGRSRAVRPEVTFSTPPSDNRLIFARFSSSRGGGGGLGKLFVYTAGAAAVGTAAIVGYAYWDPTFRQNVEINYPQSKTLFDTLIGKKEGDFKADASTTAYDNF